MVRLEDVSIKCLHMDIIAPTTKDFIKEFNIVTVKDLLDNKDKLSPIEQSEVDYILKRFNRIFDLANENQKEPVIYHSKNYTDSSLRYVDEFNKGIILITDSPAIDEIRTRYYGIKNKTIATIKRELSLCTPRGDNYLVRNCYGLSQTGAENVVFLVDMYTEQVERQAALTSDRTINLFTYQNEEKEQLARDNYAKIVDYFVEGKEEYIWGKMSKTQAKKLLSSVNGKGVANQRIKNRLVTILVNYTTLEEVEEITHNNYDSLKRFVKKR